MLTGVINMKVETMYGYMGDVHTHWVSPRRLWDCMGLECEALLNRLSYNVIPALNDPEILEEFPTVYGRIE